MVGTISLRRFGTEITNTGVIQTEQGPQPEIKKTTSIKNKFFDHQAVRLEEKEDVEMEEDKVESDSEDCIEPTDMDVDSEDSTDPERSILDDAKAKRAERRKVVLKELEVCDLLDL